MNTPFRDRLAQTRPLLMDGATGTELARRGMNLSAPGWSAAALWERPELLTQIHRDYVAAGAELITANTFRTHARNLQDAGRADQAEHWTRRAVELAREAAGNQAYVAGSVAPLEDCYSPQRTPEDAQLRTEHARMAAALVAAGVDLILIETQVTIREALIAAEAARRTGLPFCVSFVCNRRGQVLSGESLREAFEAVLPLEPSALLLNCIPAEEVLGNFAPLGSLLRGTPKGAYANTGRLLPTGSWEATDGAEPAVYAGYARDWMNHGLQLIGGCCGTTPEHISAIRSVI